MLSKSSKSSNKRQTCLGLRTPHNRSMEKTTPTNRTKGMFYVQTHVTLWTYKYPLGLRRCIFYVHNLVGMLHTSTYGTILIIPILTQFMGLQHKFPLTTRKLLPPINVGPKNVVYGFFKSLVSVGIRHPTRQNLLIILTIIIYFLFEIINFYKFYPFVLLFAEYYESFSQNYWHLQTSKFFEYFAS